ncbi:hypothetical protein V6N11_002271 [Hibiscus sabdariffa]|uniref:Uncharacterized protein n=1 Tax=Hibiscus sabdariffa TaxID=183260 RepID=A0ABR2QUS9_9ROSI
MPVCPRAVRLAGGGWDSGVFGVAVLQPHGGIGQFRWLHREGLVQFRWQNRGGPVQSRWQHQGGPVQFRWQHWGGPVQFRWQHRGGSCWPFCAAGPIGGAGECWLGLARMPPGAWLWPPLGHCPPLQHSCATRSPHSDVGLPRARLAWPADWACSTDVVGIMGAGMMVWCASSGTLMPLLATMLVTALVVPPPRPHKRQASSSDPSRAKRSRASSSSSTRIPSTSKAGMSSVNNSPAETARQSRREK